MFGNASGAADDSTHGAHGTLPEYVKLHPSDSGSGLAPVFWKREFLSPPPPLGSNGTDESEAF